MKSLEKKPFNWYFYRPNKTINLLLPRNQSMRKKQGTYSISVVADMLGIHQQTIRLYEKEGLINPNRSSGNTRQFTEEDVEQLEEVIHLTHKLGVNLAGVSMILKLQKKIKKLQGQINRLFEETSNSLELEGELLRQEVKTAVKGLAAVKRSAKIKQISGPKKLQSDYESDPPSADE
jgi:MerR family transcriptional regulator/heat shock protein HspR